MERNVLVDRLKGYACFLVLFGHVIMGIRKAGVPVPFFFEGIEQFIWSFHVALFLFLSGVVYTITGEWRGKKSKWKFIVYKLVSLGVPYVLFSAVYILLNSFAGQVNTASSITDILYIWKTPVAQYWFLYALFFLFVVWTALSGILKNWMTTLVMVLITYAVPMLGGSLGCFEVVFSSALAFGLGTCVCMTRLEKPPVFVKWLVVFLHVAIGILLVWMQKIESPYFKEGMLVFGIYASIQLISLLQNYAPMARFLDFINKYSFQIYLLHTIFTAGIRVVLLRLGMQQWWLHVIVGTLCGLFFSVLAAKIAKKVPILNFCFFPTKAFVRKKETSV